MKSPLEEYIRDHREEFDSEEPDPKVWNHISDSLQPQQEQKPARHESPRLIYIRWAAAAAVLILAVWGIWYFTGQRQQNVNPIASGNTQSNSAKPKQELPPHNTDSQSVATLPKDTSNATHRPSFDQSEGIDQGSINEEMYHYAKIVELRQKELKKLEKDEPLLYRQFSGDVYKLDSVYRSLKRQLEINPNREQLLEAMIQNLQLQIALLNHQLDIIKQINYSKKSAYEKAYKPA